MKRKPYPNIKPSRVEWLGDVPAHWRVARMRFHVQMNPSKQEVAGKAPDTEVTFLPMEAVGEDGSLSLDQFRRLEDVLNGYTYFAEDDVAYAKITPCFENGKGALLSGLEDGFGFGTTELTILRARNSARPRFVWWLTQSHPFRKLGEASMYGAGGQKRVPDSFAADFSPAWPPLEEQDAITAFLDRETAKIDTLIAEQQTLIEGLREKHLTTVRKVISRGFNRHAPLRESGIEWIGKIPAHWELWKVSHGFGCISSGTTPPTNEDKWYQGSIPWVTTSELREELITETSKCVSDEAVSAFSALRLHPEGSLLVAMYGATIGRLGILGVPATTNQACCVLSDPRFLDVRFTFYWLLGFKQVLIDLFAAGGGQPNINMAVIAGWRIPAPDVSEQKAIAAFLDTEADRINRLIAEAEASIALLQEHRSALITAVVTGKVDVREATA